MTAPVERPDWLVVGAPVVTWDDNGSHESTGIAVTKVAKIARHSFTTQKGERFLISSMSRSFTDGTGAWARTKVRRVASTESEVGRVWTHNLRTVQARNAADDAVALWRKTRKPSDGRAASAAINRWAEMSEES